MKIGIIAIQGNIEEHISALKRALEKVSRKSEIITIKHKGIIESCDALILPGGESTTLSKLMEKEGIVHEIKRAVMSGTVIMGTCAGLILLAKNQVSKSNTSTLNLMDITVQRNAFGRQKDSFETNINIKGFSSPYNAVFIRAPSIVDMGNGVEVLSELDGKIVFARQDNMIALAFHPELTKDSRIHEYFLNMFL